MTWLEDKLNPDAPTTPARTIGAAFAPSAAKHVLGLYTLEQVCDEGETSLIELLSDAANPPTTVRATAKLTVGAANGDAVTTRQQLVYLCPPGHFIKFVATQTGTSSIEHQVEIALS